MYTVRVSPAIQVISEEERRVRLTIGQIKETIKFYKFENGKPALAVRKFQNMKLKMRKAQQLYKEKEKWK